MNTYGLHKDSGICHDAIRYAKPAILSESYPVLDEISSSIVTYSQDCRNLREIDKASGNPKWLLFQFY